MTDKEKQIFDRYGNYDFPTDIKQEALNSATTQIEEMVGHIEFSLNINCPLNRGGHCDSCTYNKYGHDCQSYSVATYLYNAGYRKIPENAVVLTEEEFNEKYVLIDALLLAKEELEFIKRQKEKQIDEVRKETAKEIAEKLKKKTHNYYPSIDSYCCSIKVVELKEIYELLKEYEVEE